MFFGHAWFCRHVICNTAFVHVDDERQFLTFINGTIHPAESFPQTENRWVCLMSSRTLQASSKIGENPRLLLWGPQSCAPIPPLVSLQITPAKEAHLEHCTVWPRNRIVTAPCVTAKWPHISNLWSKNTLTAPVAKTFSTQVGNFGALLSSTKLWAGVLAIRCSVSVQHKNSSPSTATLIHPTPLCP